MTIDKKENYLAEDYPNKGGDIRALYYNIA